MEFLDGAFELWSHSSGVGKPTNRTESKESHEQTMQSPRYRCSVPVVRERAYNGATCARPMNAQRDRHRRDDVQMRRDVRPRRPQFLFVDYYKVELVGEGFAAVVEALLGFVVDLLVGLEKSQRCGAVCARPGL